MKELDRADFAHVAWSFHIHDWDRKKMKYPGILAILMHQVCENKGGVILLHDMQKNTAYNLSKWLDAIKCAGHTHHPLSDFYGEEYMTFPKSFSKRPCPECPETNAVPLPGDDAVNTLKEIF